MILCNPAIGCKCPPAKREEMKIPSGETMQRVLIQAKEENYYELFPLEFATGLRLRELAALQWDDLNLTTGELRIDKQASRYSLNKLETSFGKRANRTPNFPPRHFKVGIMLAT